MVPQRLCLRSLVIVLLATALVAVPAWAQAPINGDNGDAPAAPVVKNAAFERADLDHNGVLDASEFSFYTSGIKKALLPFLDYDAVSDDGAFNPNANGGDRGAAANINANGRAGGRFRGPGTNKFWSGFVSGILTIWATEIGDKTFFIAAILSMKQDRVVVFAGAVGALMVMTVLSVVMGVVATKFLPPSLTHYIGAILFVVFGVRMLYDARNMSSTCVSDRG
jgi:hypothetical protein